jgi:hypothetical protein
MPEPLDIAASNVASPANRLTMFTDRQVFLHPPSETTAIELPGEVADSCWNILPRPSRQRCSSRRKDCTGQAHARTLVTRFPTRCAGLLKPGTRIAPETSKAIRRPGSAYALSQSKAIDLEIPGLEGNHGVQVNRQASRGLPRNRSRTRALSEQRCARPGLEEGRSALTRGVIT